MLKRLCFCLFSAPLSKVRWTFLTFVALSLSVAGQDLRLTNYDAPMALYINPMSLYNYNRYEGSRIDIDLTAVYPNERSKDHHNPKYQLIGDIYGAYGFADKGFKYGGALTLSHRVSANARRFWTLGLYGAHDLEQAASRRLSEYDMLSFADNASYLSSRFVGVNGGSLLFTTRFNKLKLATSFRLSWEDYRFDNNRLIYPYQNRDLKADVKRFEEVKVRIDRCPDFKHNDLTLQLRGGLVHDAEQRAYFSSLLQYNADLGKTGLHLFGQAGYASAKAPYSRIFDLSGTGFSHYFFRHNFLTVAPNAFSANTFAHICINYTTPEPLWNTSWSNPRPFAQANAMIGWLSGEDAGGYAVTDGLYLRAPNKGILEPAVGIDGLIRWGVLDVGFGVAYKVCPASASYRTPDPSQNFAFLLVFNFIYDRLIMNI